MSTRDPLTGGATGLSAELPQESRLGGAFAPSVSALATSAPSAAPTPGLSPAVLRVPSAPTLPDWDPSALGQAMLRLANDLFTAPPAPSAPAAADSGFEAEPPVSSAGALAPSAGAGFAAPAAPPDRASPGIAPQLIGAAPASAAAPPAAPSAAVAQAPAAAGAPGAEAPAAVAAAPAPPSASPSSQPSPSPFTSALDLDAVAAIFGAGLGGPGLPGLPPPSAPPAQLPLLEGPGAAAADQPYWLAVPASPEPVASSAPQAPAAPAPSAPSAAPVPYQITLGEPPALARTSAPAVFDAHALAREFPILRERVHGKRLVWLDNAATTQKPQAVIDRLAHFYTHENSNIHRAAHTLAARATEAYEQARATVRRFLNAPSVEDIIFVRGATEGINLVAQSWGRRNIGAGDEIVLTWLEHHANIVPWQQLAAERGAHLRVAPVDDRGQIILEEYDRLLGPRTRLVAMTQVSNALGTITPARQMIELAHRRGIPVLLDGAQAVSHLRVDVQALDCDFYVLSGHKVFGPTGIGAVYGKRALLEAMPPWQGGGNMIQDVTFERTLVHGPPARFEAGTGNIADAVGLGAALDWLTRVGLEAVTAYEHELLEYATAQLRTVPGLTLIGTAPDKAGVLSFVLAGHETQAVGGLLDQEGIAVRSGHHCAQPILRRFGVEATVRASLAPYNTHDDIDALAAALHRLQARA